MRQDRGESVGFGEAAEEQALDATRHGKATREFEVFLRTRIVGQEAAVEAVTELYQIFLAGMAPVFALMAAFTKATARRALLISALVVMLVGTISTYVAFEAGKAASTAELTAEVRPVVEQHREFAGLTRSSFTLATLLFSLTLLLCGSLHLRVHELTGVLPLGAALFYSLGLFWLINAAYQGERLVHELGVGRS